MENDESEFYQIYEAFRPKIHRYLARLVGETEAEDLTQEVFIKVDKALKTFRRESLLSTWIYRIATHAAIDKIRSAAHGQSAELNPLDDPEETEDKDIWTGEETPSLERQLMRKEMVECFDEYVEKLPLSYRTVFVLSDLEELSNKEIAEILGLSVDVVKIRLHRGRSKLLRELRTHCKAEDWL